MEKIDRIKHEKEHFEKKYSEENFDFNTEYKLVDKVAYGINQLGTPYEGLVLDLCSGTGITTFHLARFGWRTVAIDISYNAIKISKKLSILKGVSGKVNHLVSAAEFLPFKNNSFDFVFCNGGLHHTEIKFSGEEVARVLKPGGTGIFVETSAFNPLLMFARKYIAGKFGIPKKRTPDEHPITNQDLKILSEHFRQVNILKSFHFLSRAGGYLVKSGGLIDRILNSLDKVILSLPFMKRMGYWIVIKVVK